jgi:uncharacterized protein
MTDFKEIQRQWGRWLRDSTAAAPEGIEARRLAVYRRLVRNNIENFLERGFPVLVQVLGEDGWRKLVARYLSTHAAKSPLFSNIGAEFVEFLASSVAELNDFPPFCYELASYERMEVDALYADVDYTAFELELTVEEALAKAMPFALNSSIHWGSFNFPVHQISPDFQPSTVLPQPIFIAVYRELAWPRSKLPNEAVKFLQLTPVTLLLLEQIQQHESLTLAAVKQHMIALLPQFSAEQLSTGLDEIVPQLMLRRVLLPLR